MRTLLVGWLLVLASGCAVRAGGAFEPQFADAIDPTIAVDRLHGYRWDRHDVISIGFSYYETWLATLAAADRIPPPIRVTEIVPADVLDRLDAVRSRAGT
jgi:hypothetical protein